MPTPDQYEWGVATTSAAVAAASAAASATAMGMGREGERGGGWYKGRVALRKKQQPREAAETESDSGEECMSAPCPRGVAERAAVGRGGRGKSAGPPVEAADRVGVVPCVDGGSLHVYIGRRKYCENLSNHSAPALTPPAILWRHVDSPTAMWLSSPTQHGPWARDDGDAGAHGASYGWT